MNDYHAMHNDSQDQQRVWYLMIHVKVQCTLNQTIKNEFLYPLTALMATKVNCVK